MQTSLELDQVVPLLEGRHGDPFAVLGPHEIRHGDRPALSIRAFVPGSSQVWLLDARHPRPRPMRRVHPAGLFETVCSDPHMRRPSRYQLLVVDPNGSRTAMYDPYAFPPLLTDFDLHLFGEGKHWRIYERMGAHVRTVDGITGVNFAVWAPNATAVSVIGDFNHWDGRRHPMRKHVPSGVWEIFIPGLQPGALYKYRVRFFDYVQDKADPYAAAAELPPRTASVVADLGNYTWNDEAWLKQRPQRQALDAPISIYEVHLGSWRHAAGNHNGWLNYRELAHQLVEYAKNLGYTHLQLLPVSEHPFTGSWGYQTTGYYAPTSRYGSPEDFMYFVDYCHQHELGVLVDWVPAHFPRDAHGLAVFDGTHLYEHADPRLGEHRDWGTLIYNYRRHEVRNFLVANALFWLDKYHIDGLRVDAVASMLYLDYSRQPGDWIPNEFGGNENLGAIEFIKQFNEQVHIQFPGVLTVAEESTAWPGVSRPTYVGGLGFSMKWNMGWMNDTLHYIRHEPIHRKYHHDELTFSMMYAFTENFVLPLSHDEVVHGKGSLLDKMPGDLWQRFANLRLLFGYMWTHPGKKLLFMGGEWGQWNEWKCDSSLQWDLLQWESHRGVQKLVADLNHLLRREPALHQIDFDWHGFEWIDCHNYDASTLSFIRRAADPQDYVLVVCNFTPMVRSQFVLGVPEPCFYREILNTDSAFYAGSNVGNFPGCQAEPVAAHGRPYSIRMTMPPLAMVVFKPQR